VISVVGIKKMDKNQKQRLLKLLKYEGICLGILAVGTFIPLVSLIIWFPVLLIACRINPRPPFELTIPIAIAEYALFGLILWIVSNMISNQEMPTTDSTLSTEGAFSVDK
jgi:hypothetical protein